MSYANSPQFSILIPCFNEEDAIASVAEAIDTSIDADTHYELIIIDDGSTDSTPSVVQKLSEQYPKILIISHRRNLGYGAALKTGIQKARSDLIVIIDADKTYPAAEIPNLIAYLTREDADMVVGSRLQNAPGHSRLRSIPKLFLRRYAEWISDQEIPDLNSGMRVFRKRIAQRFLGILPNGFSFTTTITLALMTNFYDVRFYPVNYLERVGKSKIRPFRDTLNFLNLIVRAGVYFAPYRIFAPIGLLFGLSTMISGIYDFWVVEDLTGKTVVFLLLFLNTTFFAVLAEIIDRRGSG